MSLGGLLEKETGRFGLGSSWVLRWVQLQEVGWGAWEKEKKN